ncbi:hypothetical protein JXA85_04475 [Candidatus Woesearchaeota archaeon]|nr:hypothetical protein [Candidatus Woesearchaeota archaeon]
MVEMPMTPFFNPTGFLTEGIYTLVILVFCLLVYFKTKEIYDLTKHNGIKYFRYAFLFFGLAYASRLILYIMMISNRIFFDEFMPRRATMPLSNLFVAYFSTLAILYMTYSSIWKKIESEHFLTFSNIVAMIVAAMAFIFRSPFLVSLIQLLLLIVTVIVGVKTYSNHKKKTKIRALYFLIAGFWLINLLFLEPGRFLPFEFKVGFQIISLFVFIAIYYKISKWVK